MGDERGEKTRWFIGWHQIMDSMPHVITQHGEQKPEFNYYEYVRASEVKWLREILAMPKWVSCEKDNMEFSAKITCYTMDKIRKGLNNG